MKLYHGSKNSNLNAIKKMQAKAGEGIEVPEDELKNGIYLILLFLQFHLFQYYC